MKKAREKIVNSAFCKILGMCEILDGDIYEANRFENGWVVVKGIHKETGLPFTVEFNIAKVEE